MNTVVSLGNLSQNKNSIASGQTTTGEIPTAGLSLVGIELPAAMTGTSISFLVAMDLTANGGVYQPLYNAAGQVVYTIAGGRYIAINPVDFYGAVYLKIVSNASEAAPRALTLMMKGI